MRVAAAVALACGTLCLACAKPEEDPPAPVWPEVFHALCTQNRSGDLAVVDLYYDWPGGRNLNLIQSQGGEAEGPLWDNEQQNGSTYYYTPTTHECSVIDMGVGLLPPDWLAGATYLGDEDVGLYRCHKWEKGDIGLSGALGGAAATAGSGAGQWRRRRRGGGQGLGDEEGAKFVTYWSEIGTDRPVRWIFFDGMEFEVVRFDPGQGMPDSSWQLPAYCFPPAQAVAGGGARPGGGSSDSRAQAS